MRGISCRAGLLFAAHFPGPSTCVGVRRVGDVGFIWTWGPGLCSIARMVHCGRRHLCASLLQVEKNTTVFVSGYDKEVVGQFAATIR